ncbi:hypothetical protein F3Y22_tig00110931pilonHSYRG00114 [Hibiscus syriacus]|uniref:39S ribosomal protein L47 n=1 Tax=Hibiscus syriacus TaxID=106335 RepID=A0A6A2ZCR8_HIBSY|nr:hypothetical protein F3Y22_tig00110931pilonHSYRG00114 [Hibiscus syriacus]
MVVLLSSSSSSSTVDFFSKDGRRISVGDCALFKPPRDSPPFIGIIRCLTSDKENKLNLCVNWLYRPAEVKLGKGILLEAVPNENFYSFHEDEIPAASLLHPCKQGFAHLCVGEFMALQTSVYGGQLIKERQEVDQLLYKTHLEMHTTVQQGGRSPKPINGKKREQGDQGFEPVKREHTSKMDDGDSGHSRPEVNLKSEIGKITEKGGLEDFLGVEKLVQLMLCERNEKKIDLVSRSMLACVIAATDKFDCLSHFVQLQGLPVFDEWLQEVQKGKIGDALQMCNIGKSVNHLRSHKNIEIQKKARSLVDTWKKRVEAEMDAKSGSNQAVPWSARARLSEVSHGGSKHCGPSEVAMKTSVIQLSASKTCSVKIAQGETTTKPASASPGPMKAATSPASASTNLKDAEARNATVGGTTDPHAITRDEKSSSSSQSHNNSQSCSSDHGKTGGVSGKEDARSSPAGSGTVAKISGSSSRHRKSINGFLGTPGVQREAGSSKNSHLHRNPASEKISQSGLTCEKALEPPMVESNSHRFTLKILNRGRSPAQSASGGSLEDHSVMNSRASSPVLSEKHEQLDHNMKEKSDSYRANVISDVNTESWQSNDFKDVLTGSDEGNGSPAAFPAEEDCRNGEDSRKAADVTKTASSSSGNDLKSGKVQEASFSSINALIDSVKYSKASECIPVGDDSGMNLLASVATGDFSKSNFALTIDSPLRNTPLIEHSSTGNNTKLKPHSGDEIVQNQNQPAEGADDQYQKQGVAAGNSWAKNADSKTGSALESFGELKEHLTSSSIALPQIADQCLENGKLKEVIMVALVSMPSAHRSASVVNEEVIDPVVEVEKVVEGSSSVPSIEVGVDNKKIATKGLERGSQAHQKLSVKETYKETLPPCPTKDITLENVDEAKPEMDVEIDALSHASKKPESEVVTAQKGEHMQDKKECSECHEPPGGPSPCKASPETEQPKRPRGSKVTGVETDEAEDTSVTTETPRIGVADTDAKVEFDLNKDFNAEEGKSMEPNKLKVVGCSAPVELISSLAFPVSSVSSSLPASITVAAAAKKSLDMPLGTSNTSIPDATIGKQSRPPLDIDLNVSDEKVLEDLPGTDSAPDLSNNRDLKCELVGSAPYHSSGWLDLDLNRVDEPADLGHSSGNGRKIDAPMHHVKSAVRILNGEASFRRDFDLNNGPTVDEVNAEPSLFSHHSRNSNVLSQAPVPGLQISNTEMANFSSWFPAGNTYSAVTIPSILSDREQPFPIVATGGPQRVLAPPTGATPYDSDIYRGPVLSSAPAGPFPSTPFQYPVFPFGTTFPLPSTFSGSSTTYADSSSGGSFCFRPVHSQLLGSAGAVPSHYTRPPYVVSLTEGSYNSGAEGGKKWGRQGLDLNSGPRGPDIERRDETAPFASRHLSVASSQALAEQQARMYQVSGGVLKRKEPEGGWDGYKQSSWQ